MTPMAASKTSKTRRPRGSIDQEMILAGAFEVATDRGLEGMSMPALAKHLGVGVTSIYWHYRNKEHLLQDMHEAAGSKLRAQVEDSTSGNFAPEDWRAYLEQLFHALHKAYLADILATQLLLDAYTSETINPSLGSYLHVEAELEYLVSAGFTPEDAWLVYSMLSMYTRQVVLMKMIGKTSLLPPSGAAQLSVLHPVKTPLLSSLVAESGFSLDATDQFSPTLQIMLNAAELKLAASTNSRS